MPVDDYQIGKRIESPDDPERCAGMAGNNQCQLKRVVGSKMCAAHGGNMKTLSEKAESANRYRLTKWHARMAELSGDNSIKSLRDEIGILRMLLEERINACKTDLDLIMHSGPISDLILKVERLVKSCHDIDKDFENLLDKQQVLNLADQIIQIINQEVKDTDIMENIQRKLITVFTKGRAKSDEQSQSNH